MAEMIPEFAACGAGAGPAGGWVEREARPFEEAPACLGCGTGGRFSGRLGATACFGLFGLGGLRGRHPFKVRYCSDCGCLLEAPSTTVSVKGWFDIVRLVLQRFR